MKQNKVFLCQTLSVYCWISLRLNNSRIQVQTFIYTPHIWLLRSKILKYLPNLSFDDARYWRKHIIIKNISLQNKYVKIGSHIRYHLFLHIFSCNNKWSFSQVFIFGFSITLLINSVYNYNFTCRSITYHANLYGLVISCPM